MVWLANKFYKVFECNRGKDTIVTKNDIGYKVFSFGCRIINKIEDTDTNDNKKEESC